MSWSRPAGRRNLDDVEHRVQRGHAGRAVGELGRDAAVAQVLGALVERLAIAAVEHVGQRLRHRLAPGSKRSIACSMSIARGLARTSQRVARSTRRRPSISIVSWTWRSTWLSSASTSRPERAHVEDLARDRVGAREYRRAARRSPRRSRKDERRARAVDELVGDDGRDDLAAQPVRAHLVAVALGQRRREVALELVGRGTGPRAGRTRAAARTGRSCCRPAAPRARARRAPSAALRSAIVLVGGQELERAVEPPRLLEVADQAGVDVEPSAPPAPGRGSAPAVCM